VEDLARFGAGGAEEGEAPRERPEPGKGAAEEEEEEPVVAAAGFEETAEVALAFVAAEAPTGTGFP
jgi:hypothetical protein